MRLSQILQPVVLFLEILRQIKYFLANVNDIVLDMFANFYQLLNPSLSN